MEIYRLKWSSSDQKIKKKKRKQTHKQTKSPTPHYCDIFEPQRKNPKMLQSGERVTHEGKERNQKQAGLNRNTGNQNRSVPSQ